MASICRSASICAVRSAAVRSRPVPSKQLSFTRATPISPRSVCAAVGCWESQMHLRSVVVPARPISFSAGSTAYWSTLFQGLAEPS